MKWVKFFYIFTKFFFELLCVVDHFLLLFAELHERGEL